MPSKPPVRPTVTGPALTQNAMKQRAQAAVLRKRKKVPDPIALGSG